MSPRPRTKPQQPRNRAVMLNFRATAEEAAEIRADAKRRGLSIAGLIRLALSVLRERL